MRYAWNTAILVGCGVLILAVAAVWPAAGQQGSTTPSAPTPGAAPIDAHQLFATTCGWCHSDGGRAAGKGPQLMATTRTDDFIRQRIKTGKQGAMPAFDQVLDDAEIDEIIKYIRELKPD